MKSKSRHQFDEIAHTKLKNSIYKGLSPYWKDVFEAPYEILNWDELSIRCDLTFEIIYSYMRLHHKCNTWNWKLLSWNNSLRWDIIIDTLYKIERPAVCVIDGLYSVIKVPHKNNTLESFIGSRERLWDWKGISRNPYVTWDLIQMTPLFRWDAKSVALNPNIHPSIIKAFPTLPGYIWKWEW